MLLPEPVLDVPDVPAVLPDPAVEPVLPLPDAVVPEPLPEVPLPDAVVPDPLVPDPVVLPDPALPAPLPIRALVRMNPPAPLAEPEPLALVPLPLVPLPLVPELLVPEPLVVPLVEPEPDVPVLPPMLPEPLALARHPTTVTVFPLCDELAEDVPDGVCAARPAALAIATAPIVANSRVMVLSP